MSSYRLFPHDRVPDEVSFFVLHGTILQNLLHAIGRGVYQYTSTRIESGTSLSSTALSPPPTTPGPCRDRKSCAGGNTSNSPCEKVASPDSRRRAVLRPTIASGFARSPSRLLPQSVTVQLTSVTSPSGLRADRRPDASSFMSSGPRTPSGNRGIFHFRVKASLAAEERSRITIGGDWRGCIMAGRQNGWSCPEIQRHASPTTRKKPRSTP